MSLNNNVKTYYEETIEDFNFKNSIKIKSGINKNISKIKENSKDKVKNKVKNNKKSIVDFF